MTDPNAQLVAMAGGVLVPILVALVAKLRASSGLKGLLNAALAGVAGAIGAAAAAGGWDWTTFGISWLQAFAVSIAAYYGVWKPTGAAPAVASATATVGVAERRAA